MLFQLRRELQNLANHQQARILQRFFKTGPGEYGEGDVFLGIKVPVQRSVAKKYPDLPFSEIQQLLRSKIHEHRMAALFVLVKQYENGDKLARKNIFDLYLKNTKNINNWDLVDLSAPNIVGNYLLDKPRQVLYKLAKSKLLWDRRISILATLAFIRNNEFSDTYKLAEILLNDKHDLMHKAVGWMLREAGKRDQNLEVKFLDRHARKMPRTMLRYAIEKFGPARRSYYLNLK
jgi:3-methyladenine DNA glycosylase AlkD